MTIETPASSTDVMRRLTGVTTATLTTVLLKKGLRNVWLRGTRPLGAAAEASDRPRLHAALRAGARRPGHARFVGRRRSRRARRSRPCPPAALPWSARWASPMPASSATSCARACNSAVWRHWSATASVRDLQGVLATGLPVWCQGTAAPPSVAGLTFVGWQEPIACGGVAVFPDDLIVVDQDGAVLVPAALMETVAGEASNRSSWKAGSWPR